MLLFLPMLKPTAKAASKSRASKKAIGSIYRNRLIPFHAREMFYGACPNPIDPAKSMERIALHSLLAAVLALAGCNPKSKEEPAQPSPTPAPAAAQPAPASTPEPATAAPQANQD